MYMHSRRGPVVIDAFLQYSHVETLRCAPASWCNAACCSVGCVLDLRRRREPDAEGADLRLGFSWCRKMPLKVLLRGGGVESETSVNDWLSLHTWQLLRLLAAGEDYLEDD